MVDLSTAISKAEELVASLKRMQRENESTGSVEHVALLRKLDQLRSTLSTPYDIILQADGVLVEYHWRGGIQAAKGFAD